MRITKNHIVYIVTILFSLAFIIVGNKICQTNAYSDKVHGIETQSAIVKKIVNVENEEYNIGEGEHSGITVKTIFFDAYMPKAKETIRASQRLDSIQIVNPKEVEVGDKILLSLSPVDDEISEWGFMEYQRSSAIMWLAVAFLGLVVIFGRKKGVNTIISLGFTCLAIFVVFVPAILAGYNIYLMSIIICLFIVIMTLLIINGASKKTLCAGTGCIGGLIVTGILTVIMDNILNLTGAVDDESTYLLMLNEQNPIDLRAIIFSAILIGALGATMDISISIASSLKEVRDNMSEKSFKALLKSGFNIGRDIMGTMANTLILAYIGSSLSVVLLLVANSDSLLNLFNREMIVVEVLQALVGSLGILFTIPITSLLCAYVYSHDFLGNSTPRKKKTDADIFSIKNEVEYSPKKGE